MPTRHTHLGIYGLIVADDSVVLIRKGRGPYYGMWDLPGGGIEFGETPVEALERELREETALSILSATPLDALSARLTYTLPSGDIEDLHHIGFVYRVVVKSLAALKTTSDGYDSLGSRAVPLKEVDSFSLTPFATSVISRLRTGA